MFRGKGKMGLEDHPTGSTSSLPDKHGPSLPNLAMDRLTRSKLTLLVQWRLTGLAVM